jgi:Calcineurin-like phosphoesterase
MVNSQNVGFFGSGTSITVPAQFFGGPKNATKLVNTVLGNWFPRTIRDEVSVPTDKYLLFYVQNLHTTEPMNNVVAWFDHNTISPDDNVMIGKAAAPKNTSETRVTDINTEPKNVAWFSAPTYELGLALGRLRPLDYIGIWNWLHIRPNSKPIPVLNHYGLMITFDPPAGTTTDGGTGGTGGGGTGGGQTNIPPVTLAPFTLAAASDFGCGSEMKRTLQNMLTVSPDWLLSSGDLSYDSKGTCFINNMGTYMTKFRTSWGNHDRAEGNPSTLVKKYQTAMGIGDTFWYSFVHKNVFMLFCDQYSDYSVNSLQYQFIKSQLETQKNNDNIEWRMVFFHEPIYCADSKHGILKKFRDIYHPIFDANKVDVMHSSHNHSLQVSFPIRYNAGNPASPTVHSTGNPDYTDPDGIINLVNGGGGRDLYSLNNSPAYNSYQTKEFGFMTFTVDTNGKRMIINTFVNEGVNNRDTITITKT